MKPSAFVKPSASTRQTHARAHEPNLVRTSVSKLNKETDHRSKRDLLLKQQFVTQLRTTSLHTEARDLLLKHVCC